MALSPSGTPLYTTLVLGPCIKAQTNSRTIYLLGVAQVNFNPKPWQCQYKFFRVRKSAKNGAKPSFQELGGEAIRRNLRLTHSAAAVTI